MSDRVTIYKDDRPVLSIRRRVGEAVHLDHPAMGRVTITVVRASRTGQMRLAIQAPRSVAVLRGAAIRTEAAHLASTPERGES